MKMHEFKDGSNENRPVMVLLHGLLTPWQIWMPQIEAFRDRYDIYAVALSAHTEEYASEFSSLAEEADKIIQCLKESGIEEIDVLCGISFGGKIAHEVWKTGKLPIRNLVMDGAPLEPFPQIVKKFFAKEYLSIIHKSKVRDPKTLENFKRDFLPEKYLESYLKIADNMSDSSITGMANASGTGNLGTNIKNSSRILFIHGTKGNEIISQKSAKRMKKYYPETEIICFKGDAHCQKALFEPEKWIETVSAFLGR